MGHIRRYTRIWIHRYWRQFGWHNLKSGRIIVNHLIKLLLILNLLHLIYSLPLLISLSAPLLLQECFSLTLNTNPHLLLLHSLQRLILEKETYHSIFTKYLIKTPYQIKIKSHQFYTHKILYFSDRNS